MCSTLKGIYMEKIKINKPLKLDIIIPVILFTALFIFKMLFVINNRSMPLIADEYTYAKYAKLLFNNGSYRGVQYPLLYPLILAPAYLFENHYYVMKVLNAFYSSFTPVVVYFISRLYLDKYKSTVCSIFSMVIPYQYITTMTLMSENIYYPMFLLGIYVTLKKHRNELLGDIALGIILGALFLTRHITLVCIPVFLFVWLLKQFDLKKDLKTIVFRGALICIVMLLTYSPWIIMCSRRGYSIKKIIGFSIASKTNPEQLTIKRLFMSGIFYIEYLILMIAPVLGLIIKSFRALDIKKLFGDYNRLWVMVFGITGAFWLAVTRHSWRAYYNYPEFIKIKGRYVIYFSVMFVILGMVVLYKQKPQFKFKTTNILLTYITPALLIVASYIGQIKLMPYLIDVYECIDGRKIMFMGTAFVPIVILGVFVYQYIYDYAKSEWKKLGNIAVIIVIIGIEVWGMKSYIERAKSGDEYNNRFSYLEARNIMNTIDNIDEEKIYIYAEDMPSATLVKRALEFYLYDNTIFTTDISKVKGDVFYVILSDKKKYEDYLIETVSEYKWEEKTYYLQKIQVKE